jgi:transketolase
VDALVSTELADRRPSITRLLVALRRRVDDHPVQQALCLPFALLLARHLRFDAADPLWADRDRVVVSKPASCLGQAATSLLGAPHPPFHTASQALGCATGMALAERTLAARFGRSLVDHRTWVFGTGTELATGASLEAAWLAGHWRLGRLTLIETVPASDAPGLACFSANGWSVRRVAAQDAGEIASAMSAALRSVRPTLIAVVRPTSRPARDPAAPPGDPESEGGLLAESQAAWRITGRRAAGARRAWLKRLARHASRQDFDQAAGPRLTARWHTALVEPGPLLPPGETMISTAAALRAAMARLATAMPDLMLLPASGPTANLAAGVAAALCGAAMHDGLLPIGTHTLGELEQVRPALREAASQGLRLIQVLVEPANPCPVGGELACLRAMRNVAVFRPADASELLECFDLALRRSAGPSVVLVSEARQSLLSDRPSRTRSARGGHIVAEAARAREVTLIATGTDMRTAIAAHRALTGAGVMAALVSLPCWDLFAQQDPAWRERVLGEAPRVALEAGGVLGWERWIGNDGLFVDTRHVGTHDAASCGEAPEPQAITAGRRAAEAIQRHLVGYRAH